MIDDTRTLKEVSESRLIQDWAEESDLDPVGFFGIVRIGRKFLRLTGPDLESFVRRVLLALMRAGARPVIGGGRKGPYPWIVQPRYGSTPEEIVDAVVQEWLASGEDPDAGGLWFATPSVYNLTRS